MRPDEYRCECGHLATRHTDDSDERCTVTGCGCESFMHDEESWRALAQHMAGPSDEVLAPTTTRCGPSAAASTTSSCAPTPRC